MGKLAEIEKIGVDDIDMAYSKSGSGEPLVLIMGYTGNMESWMPPFLESLSQHYKLILFDNRGTGGTPVGSRVFTIGQFAEDTAGLMEALGIEKAHVLGWSMGTFIAQELALAYPNRVDKMILVSAYCGGPEAPPLSPKILDEVGDMSGSVRDIIGRQLKLLLPEKWVAENPESLEEILSFPIQFPPHETINKQKAAINNWAGTYERLPRIKSQTLLLTGTEDIVIRPENSLLMVNQTPGSWLVRLEGAGHGIMIQYPHKCAGIMIDFLSRKMD